MKACQSLRHGRMDSQNDSGVEFMKRLSNTQASRTYAERDERDRIYAHLDQALELTFPRSDPVAITINGIYGVFGRKAATDSGESSFNDAPPA